jgi:hypothetical protein
MSESIFDFLNFCAPEKRAKTRENTIKVAQVTRNLTTDDQSRNIISEEKKNGNPDAYVLGFLKDLDLGRVYNSLALGVDTASNNVRTQIDEVAKELGAKTLINSQTKRFGNVVSDELSNIPGSKIAQEILTPKESNLTYVGKNESAEILQQVEKQVCQEQKLMTENEFKGIVAQVTNLGQNLGLCHKGDKNSYAQKCVDELNAKNTVTSSQSQSQVNQPQVNQPQVDTKNQTDRSFYERMSSKMRSFNRKAAPVRIPSLSRNSNERQ